VQVRLLGPVDVTVDGTPRPVRGLRRKAVLAVLALHGGEIVSTDRLADVVWGEAAPLTVVNTLQHNVLYLRQVLGSKAAILARPPGYVLDLGSEATDVQVADRLIRQGTQAAGPMDSARYLRAALALWRGRPLVDVGGVAWLEEQARRLDQLRHRASCALIDARLELGEHAQLVPDLEGLTLGHPFDEQIHGQLMLALYRSGRQADALAAFRRLRRALGDDLGIDPSEPLRDLHTAILRQDPALAAASPPATTLLVAPALAAVPAQLPSAVPAFTGRSSELARLDSLLPGTAAAAGPAPAVVISAASGTAGLAEPATAQDALSWFTTEHAALLDAIRLAAEAGFGTCTWQLARTLTTFFLRRGHWHDQTAAQAHPYFRHALQLFEKIGNHCGQAHVHSGLTWLSERQDRPADALAHALRALDLFITAGHLPGQIMAQNDIGWCHALLGNYEEALTYCQRALVRYQELGDRNGEAATWDSLGYIHRQLAGYRQAIACYQNAIDIYRDLADRYNEADTLANLGDTHLGAGHPDAARRAWRHAMDILQQLGHPDADQLRAKLRPGEDPPIDASRLQTATTPQY
jgi:DNA-binding SARP family transcriptional activator